MIAAGESAPSCVAAGIAMETMFAANRPAFVDAMALDRDREKIAEATQFLEEHAARYADLETRMAALADRCGEDPRVAQVFHGMENP